MFHKSPAIILKKISYGEADLVVTFFSKKEGRLTGIAKNARISQRRFGGTFELGSIVDLSYVARNNSEMVRIEEASIFFPVIGVMLSLERIEALSKAIQFALAFLQDRQSSHEKYDILFNHIINISKGNFNHFSLLSFEMRWLSLVGYKPVLDHCIKCGNKKNAFLFSMDQGGLICKACSRDSSNKFNITADTLYILKSMSTGEQLEISNAEVNKAGAILDSYVDYILGRPFNKVSLV